MLQAGEIDHAHADSKDITCHQSDENGQRTEETLGKNLKDQTYQEGERTHHPVVDRTEISSTLTTSKRIGTNRQQRETDGCDHRSCYDMRNEFGPIIRKQSQQAFDNTAKDDGTHQHSHALRRANGNGYGQERKTYTHDDGQSRTYPPDRIELDECADTCDNHTVLYQRSTDVGADAHHIG